MHNLRIAFKRGVWSLFLRAKEKKKEDEMVAKLVIYSVQKDRAIR
jgi:hypothetical protein